MVRSGSGPTWGRSLRHKWYLASAFRQICPLRSGPVVEFNRFRNSGPDKLLLSFWLLVRLLNVLVQFHLSDWSTTEGLLVYSLDEVSAFDPLDLDLDVTPARVFKCLEDEAWMDALLMALRLNEAAILRSVYERIPVAEVKLLAQELPQIYLKRMLGLVASQTSESPHIEFHLLWAEALLLSHGTYIMSERSTFSAALRSMHMGFSRQYGDVSRLCQSNAYALAYLAAQPTDKVAPDAFAHLGAETRGPANSEAGGEEEAVGS